MCLYGNSGRHGVKVYQTRDISVSSIDSVSCLCEQDVLQNERIKLDDNFKFSFVKELIKVRAVRTCVVCLPAVRSRFVDGQYV